MARKFLPTLVLGAALLLVLLHSLAPTRRWQRGSAFSGSRMVEWRAVDHGATTTPYTCGSCVLDPLVYPDAYCSTTPSPTLNGTAVRPLLPELASLEPYDGSAQASFAEVLDALPRGRASTVGVLGDSFMQQTLDAIACDLRRGGGDSGAADAAFLKWDAVAAAAGRFDEAARPQRYNYAGPHGAGPKWFVLTQMFYNAAEVEKLLAASDVVLINYGLHYCQPSRAGADAGCAAQFRRHETELRALFGRLEAWAAERPGARVAVVQETSAQHFPAAADALPPGARSSGDWETRSFFPRLGPSAPERCRCTPTARHAVPLRTALLRNVSAAHPAVRLLPLHDLLAPRYGWHQQDCKVREVARARGALPADGCDCTHYCWSPHFWRHYFAALRDAIRG